MVTLHKQLVTLDYMVEHMLISSTWLIKGLFVSYGDMHGLQQFCVIIGHLGLPGAGGYMMSYLYRMEIVVGGGGS